MTEADGQVRDGELAEVVQTCIPAVPLDTHRQELTAAGYDTEVFDIPGRDVTGLREPDEATADEIADAIWGTLTHNERRAVPHLTSARGVGTILGMGRRTAAAVTESAKAKIAAGSVFEMEAAILVALVERSDALD